jgi:hypothetical protein
MSDPEAIADRFQIEALLAEFTDTSMMRDWDRFASLFTHDSARPIPDGNVELVGPGGDPRRFERLRGLWDSVVQTSHSGHPACGRHGGRLCLHRRVRALARWQLVPGYAVDHDRYQRIRTAGSSPSGSMRSDTSTPHRWRARRPRSEAFADGDARRTGAVERVGRAVPAGGRAGGCGRCPPQHRGRLRARPPQAHTPQRPQQGESA